ncbi:hypothetical protein [Nesterenkonia flava]|uniref:Uncharacterized protein n=1 Tax=Nesterenkonia flava TaxID=469799 RepID=A0ABU1FQC2_9MICC|nr:hypothetical protein [Nesterenkonia flava]MDR5710847.1 hypothetical protein [Nesterenkonia flava]
MTETPRTPEDGHDPDARNDGDHQDHDQWSRERWNRDHGAEVPRNARGGLPVGVVVVCIVVFILLFILIREMRSNFVTYYWVPSHENVLAPLGSVLSSSF